MRYLAIILVLLFLTGHIFAQAVGYQKVVGGPEDDYCFSMARSEDGGYVMCGSTKSFGAGGNDVYCVKVDSVGTLLWTKTYGGALEDNGRSIIAAIDGGYVMVGSTKSFGSGASDMYAIRIDPFGDTMWTRTYGGTGIDAATGIASTPDSGYIIVGRTSSFGAGSDDAYVVKINGAGDVLWDKVIGGPGIDALSLIEPLGNGQFVAGGYTKSSGAGNFDILLMKIQDTGQLLWAKTVGKTQSDFIASIKRTSDGGFIILGSTDQTSSISTDLYILKVDSVADISWSKTVNGLEISSDDQGAAIYQLQDGGYIMCTNTGFVDNPPGIYNACLIRTGSDGAISWAKSLSRRSYGADMLQTEDGGYAIGGFMKDSGSAGKDDLYLIKTDSLGNSGCPFADTSFTVSVSTAQSFSFSPFVTSGTIAMFTQTAMNGGGTDSNLCVLTTIPSVPTPVKPNIYPNPAARELFVETPRMDIERVRMYDASGKEFLVTYVRNLGSIQVSLTNIPAGLYYISYTGSTGSATKYISQKIMIVN